MFLHTIGSTTTTPDRPRPAQALLKASPRQDTLPIESNHTAYLATYTPITHRQSNTWRIAALVTLFASSWDLRFIYPTLASQHYSLFFYLDNVPSTNGHTHRHYIQGNKRERVMNGWVTGSPYAHQNKGTQKTTSVRTGTRKLPKAGNPSLELLQQLTRPQK